MRLVRYTPGAVLQFPILKLHQFVYPHSGGLIGTRIGLERALLLTTVGLEAVNHTSVALSNRGRRALNSYTAALRNLLAGL